MELTAVQIYIVGAVATVLAAGVRLLAARFQGFEISKFWMTILVSAISLGLAVVFSPPNLPVYVDPITFLGEWIAIISGYLGAATIVYNLLLDKLLDAVGLKTEKIAAANG